MTPEQVKNWIKFSDCVFNDITHKTNHYEIALSFFIGFDQNRQNIILAQGLLSDETQSSYVWMFRHIVEATNIYLTVILTDSNLAVDAMIKE
ncbi:2727_t:CDS:1, partial [Scutellospora calospora]